MKQLLITGLATVFIFSHSTLAQSYAEDIQLLEDLANSISDGVNNRDHAQVLNAFIHPTALIFSTYQGLSSGTFSKEQTTAQGLSDFVRDSEDKVNQAFDFVKAEMIDGGRAIVKTYYRVTINGEKSHMGDEFYSAIKTQGGWKFVSLIFTMEHWSD